MKKKDVIPRADLTSSSLSHGCPHSHLPLHHQAHQVSVFGPAVPDRSNGILPFDAVVGIRGASADDAGGELAVVRCGDGVVLLLSPSQVSCFP